jgi:hypothetical protein
MRLAKISQQLQDTFLLNTSEGIFQMLAAVIPSMKDDLHDARFAKFAPDKEDKEKGRVQLPKLH